jgi:hypothetical protein
VDLGWVSFEDVENFDVHGKERGRRNFGKVDMPLAMVRFTAGQDAQL